MKLLINIKNFKKNSSKLLMKTTSQLRKEAKQDIQKCLNEVEVTGISTPETLDFLENEKMDKIIENLEKDFQKEKKIVSNMNSEQIAEWLIEKHLSYTKTIETIIHCDFLNERDSFARHYLLTYMAELYSLLESYELTFFSKEVSDILLEKQETELLTILNCLNYIG